MVVIHTFYGSIGEPRGIETLDQHSDTVPDMSLSVKDILQRYRRGTISLEELDRNYPDSDDDIDDDLLDDVHDLVDVEQLKRYAHGKIHEVVRCSRDTAQRDSRDIGTAPSEPEVKEEK